MANSLLCIKCMKWIHGRCTKMRRVTSSSAKHFVCAQCLKVKEACQKSIGKLCDEVETVKGFCYLGDRLNASGGCEMAVTARTRLVGQNLESIETWCLRRRWLS